MLNTWSLLKQELRISAYTVLEMISMKFILTPLKMLLPRLQNFPNKSDLILFKFGDSAMDSQQYRNHLIEKANLYKPHFDQIPLVGKIFNSVQSDINDLSILALDGIENLDRIVIESILYSNNEIITSLVESLIRNNLSTVDALSRTSIEFSVNIIYVLQAESDLGAREFLDNYLAHHSTKLRKWRDHKISVGSDFELPAGLYDSFLSTKGNFEQLLHLNGRKWPNARTRFKACNLESDYVTIYSTGSDSVHSMGEDTYNYFLASLQSSAAFRTELMRYQHYERKSFSIYLSLHALRFFVQALIFICSEGDRGELQGILNDHMKVIINLINAHDDHSVKLSKEMEPLP